eukprot:1256693-Amorphochlora_amoeboformis.AAC.1
MSMSLSAVVTQGLGVPKENLAELGENSRAKGRSNVVEGLAKERGISVYWNIDEGAAEPPANPTALIMVNKKTGGDYLKKLGPKMVAVAFTGY